MTTIDISHTGPVTLINGFKVPAGRESVFEPLWAETSRCFRDKPGFISFRMHRSLSPDARFRYVNVAKWASVELFTAAHNTDEFRRLISRPEWKEFTIEPVLYEVFAESDGGA